MRLTNDPAGRPILKEALDARAEVGYLARPTRGQEAERLVKSAIRFAAFAKRHVPA